MQVNWTTCSTHFGKNCIYRPLISTINVCLLSAEQQIGNIDVPESGNVDISFYSSYVTLFGHRGIVGRSIVVHEKPIEFNRTPDLYGVPIVQPPINPVSYQTEEMAVGTTLACGIITITENRQ